MADLDPKLKAFLSLIAWSEGTSTSPITKNDGYDVIVTGINGPAIFTDYSDHPFAHGGSVQWHTNPPKYSTAAGRYQLLARYWNVYRRQMDLPDYSPASQDSVAIKQMQERSATTLLMNDAVDQAIKACSNIWASFPGNHYGQGGHSMADLLNKYEELLNAPE